METVPQLTGVQRLKNSYQLNKPKYLQAASYTGIALTALGGVYFGMSLPKAIKKAKREIREDDIQSKPKKVWKYTKHIAPIAMPMVASGIGTAYAVRGIYKVCEDQRKQLAIVSTAYASAMTELKLVKDKVEEVGGKKVAEKVKQACRDEHMKDVDDTEAKKNVEEQRNVNPNSAGYTSMKFCYYDKMLQTVHDKVTPEQMLKIQGRMLAKLQGLVAEYGIGTTFAISFVYGVYGSDKKMPVFAPEYGWRPTSMFDLECAEQHLDKAFFDASTHAVTKNGVPCFYIEFEDGMAMRMHLLSIKLPFN